MKHLLTIIISKNIKTDKLSVKPAKKICPTSFFLCAVNQITGEDKTLQAIYQLNCGQTNFMTDRPGNGL